MVKDKRTVKSYFHHELCSLTQMLLTGLIVLLFHGCDNRALTYEQKTSIPFSITLDWSTLADDEEKPQYLKALFFPVKGGAAVERFISPEGGEVQVPSGEYRIIIYNWRTNAATQTVQFRGDTYDTFEAYVAPRSTSESASSRVDLLMLPAPDEQLYGWNTGQETVIISNTAPAVRTRASQGDVLTTPMSPIVHSYVVAVNVANAQYLNGVLAVATDSYGSSLLGGGQSNSERYATETKVERTGIINGIEVCYCRVTTFGFFEDSGKTLVLNLDNVSGEVQQEKVDISEAVGKVDMGTVSADEPQITVPPETPIVVPVPDMPPPSNGGGFDPPGLSDWEEEHKDIFM